MFRLDTRRKARAELTLALRRLESLYAGTGLARIELARIELEPWSFAWLTGA